MRKLLLMTVVLAAIASPARAADMAVKAPPISNAYPTTKCGLFYGANAEGSSGIVNGAPAGTVQIGGDVGVLVGYACPTASIPWFVQADFDFQNLNAGNAGFSMKGPWHFEQVAAIQTPLFSWLGQFLNIGQNNVPAPVLPPGISLTGQPQNYVGLMVVEDDISAQFMLGSNREWLVSYGPRVGSLFNAVGPNKTPVVIDTYAAIEFQSNAMCVGGTRVVCPKLGDRFVAGIDFKM